MLIPLFSLSEPAIANGEKLIKFKKQVMVADNCYYLDNNGVRYGFSFSDKLRSLRFVGPKAQEFILEPNGNSDIKFYSLQVKRNGQQLIVFNDFVLMGEKNDFNNRKVGWIVDLNKDGLFDILQRDKLQIQSGKNSKLNSVNQRTPTSESSIYKTDVISFRIWNKNTKSFLEQSFESQKQRDGYYKYYNFKFNWRD